MRQESLYVFAFAIPSDEANDGKCMPEVMQPWLISGFLRARHASLLAQPFEHQFCRLAQNRLPFMSSKKWSRVSACPSSPLPFHVVAQHAGEIRSYRDKTALEELRLANGEYSSISIEIGDPQMKCFADT